VLNPKDREHEVVLGGGEVIEKEGERNNKM
jgi:hypothetical protein